MNQRLQVEDILQRYRRIKYLLAKPEFEGILIPQELIDRGDAQGIHEYLRRYLGLEDLTIATLRERAGILRVMPIFGLSKSELIQRIREKERELATCKKETQ